MKYQQPSFNTPGVSPEDHERVFGKTERPKRGRWVYRDGKAIPIDEGWTDEPREAAAPFTDLYMDGVRATDGADISSRKKRREYMRIHGLADADDFKGQWAKAEKEREAIRKGENDRKARREAIERAMEKVRR